MRVVVSLSTIPSRVSRIGDIIACLQQQTYPIDQIYLNIPYTSHREGVSYPELPSNLDLTNVQVIRCQDYGPITKLYPVLQYETHPNTIIITVDDDLIYRSDRIETLVRWCVQYPNAAIAGSGYIIGKWYNYFGHIEQPKEITPVSIIEGYSGCAYRRSFFDHNLIDYTGAPPESFYHDDVWISGQLSLKSIPRLVHPEPIGIPNRLPGGLSSELISCVARFFPVVQYFKEKNVFQETQTAPWYDTLSIKFFLIFLFILLLILVVIYLLKKNFYQYKVFNKVYTYASI